MKDESDRNDALEGSREEAEVERERLMHQLREANEKLVIATVQADETAEEALATEATTAAHATYLEAQDRAKDEFLAMLGHELRNPLAPILSTLDAIRISQPDVLVAERAIIEGQVKQLVRIVDDLLDLSRVTRGKIELRREPVEIAEVVARAVDTVLHLVASNRQSLQIDLAPELMVEGDFVRLAQAVGNLLSNAAKYTPARGSIVVSGERRGGEVVLRVRDNGIGISHEMLPRVFDMFAQEFRGTDRSQGGLGLGLTIAHRLIRMQGGSISARSEGLGLGSEFEIVLPASMRTKAHKPTVERSLGSNPLGIKVLIVDDNQLAAQAMGLLISKLGYEVRTAMDATSALEIAAEFVPDIGVLDIGLPKMSGYELGGRIRTLVAPHPVRLIALTGYGLDADRRRSRAAGFDEHLVKPVELETIEASLCRATLLLVGTT